jgi:hypothetical protein
MHAPNKHTRKREILVEKKGTTKKREREREQKKRRKKMKTNIHKTEKKNQTLVFFFIF